VLSGDVPSDCNLSSFRQARFFDFFNEIAPNQPLPMWARNDVGESLGVALDLPSLRCRPTPTVWPLATNSGPAISPIKGATTATNGAMIIGS
jgi:hypothetical protein